MLEKKTDYKILKVQFLKIYSKLTFNARREIILVLEDSGPITWNVACLEIKCNTKIGNTVLKKLSDLKFI